MGKIKEKAKKVGKKIKNELDWVADHSIEIMAGCAAFGVLCETLILRDKIHDTNQKVTELWEYEIPYSYRGKDAQDLRDDWKES